MPERRMPRMLLDGAEIYKVQKRRHRRINRIIQFASFLINQADSFDESRRALGVLLKEHRRFNATRIALQDGRPILQERQNEGADFQVVTKQVELRQLFLGPVNPVEAGERDAFSVNLNDQISLRFFER